MHNHSIVHRALVTYSNERTGEVRVRIPAVIGQSEVALSTVGRSPTNGIWIVPDVGDTIAVSADDHLMTNVIWLHTDAWSHSTHQRNYISVFDTTTQTMTAGQAKAITFNNVALQSGIALKNNSQIWFTYAGTYNLQFSIQFTNTHSQEHDALVWLAYNGSPYPNSGSYLTIPASHGGYTGNYILALNLLGQSVGNDYVELYWSTNYADVHITTISNGSYAGMSATAPSSPSAIVTVTQVA